MEAKAVEDLVTLDTKEPIWTRFFMVAPLVVIGTKEGDHYNLAPKHMTGPVGWDNYFAFACTPRHLTYGNIRKNGFFTVSFPKPSQVVLTSLTAEPRWVTIGKSRILDVSAPFQLLRLTGYFSRMPISS